jgi:TolB-like protein/Tfp pilus assembly protein PilF
MQKQIIAGLSQLPLEEVAELLISRMDELQLDRYRIVGEYVRFDADVRNSLKDFRLKVLSSLQKKARGRENFLLWGPPGSGKTYLLQQIAKSLPEHINYKEFNLAQYGESEFRTLLDEVEKSNNPCLCFVDEVDSKPADVWPYEALLAHMESTKEPRDRICFVLAGSSGLSLNDMRAKISSRPKGKDLLSRIMRGNEFSVPPLGIGDKLLVAVAQIINSTKSKGHSIREIEKLALYYIAVNPTFSSARQLRGLAESCASRIPEGEDRIKYDYLFRPGDIENKEFWSKTQQFHKGFSDRFVTLGAESSQVLRDVQHASLQRFEKTKVAVLPLRSISPNPDDEYFADGMTEELISAVSKIGDLRTISRSSAMRFKSTDKSITEIAAELHVGAIVEGSVRKAGNTVRINVQLVDVRKDEHLWSQSYDRKLEDVFAIQSDIANKVAEALQVHILAQERERIEKKATSNMESYTLYLKGLHHRGERTEEGYKKAIRYFEEALKKDPKFSLAYAGLAECYDLMGDEGYLAPKESFPKAEEFAKKALELDDSLAEAHATLGAVMQNYYYDQKAAEVAFRHALDLNPNYGRVCNSYGAYLACMGRLNEAVNEIGRAQELNPLALEVNNCAAVIFNCVNEFDKSVEACEKMLRVDENFLPAYQDLAEAYLERSRFEDAVEVLRKALEISKGAAAVKARLGFAYARSGKTEEARGILRELEEDSKQKYVSPIAFAIVYCGLGEKSESITYLQKACEERAGGVISVKVRPMWASLRSEPAFSQLLARMGLGSKAR